MVDTVVIGAGVAGLSAAGFKYPREMLFCVLVVAAGAGAFATWKRYERAAAA